MHAQNVINACIHVFALRKMDNNSLYNFEASLPPGITNSANNCYASSVIQCLLNHSVFLSTSEEINEEHDVCEKCMKSGKKHIQ